jgi:hypothetical protein
MVNVNVNEEGALLGGIVVADWVWLVAAVRSVWWLGKLWTIGRYSVATDSTIVCNDGIRTEERLQDMLTWKFLT